MKEIYTIILLFFFFYHNSQSVTVYDKVTYKPIPFASIQYNKNGFYVDENGTFRLNDIPSEIDSLLINHVRYKSKKIALNDIEKNIYLQPKINNLNEVLINDRYQTKTLKPLSSFIISHSSWPLSKKSEICSCLYPKNKYKETLIKQATISIKKNKTGLFKDDYQAVVRLNVYLGDSLTKGNHIFSSPIKKFYNENIDLKFNVKEQKIFFDKAGVSFCLEFLGFSKNGKILNRKAIIRPELHKKLSEAFKAKTFLKFKFKNTLTFKSVIKLINKNRLKNNPYKRRNLSIGLQLKLAK
jgi:hypothetical protein